MPTVRPMSCAPGRRNRYGVLPLLLFLATTGCSTAWGQTELRAQYRAEASTGAYLYNGEKERPYSTVQYENNPYFVSPSFTDGDVVFGGFPYPQQKLRLDLYRDQLAVLTPDDRFSVIVNSMRCDTVRLHGATFVYFRPQVAAMDEGFYQLLHDGARLKLYARKLYTLSLLKFNAAGQLIFQYGVRYYLFHEGRLIPVRNHKAILKLFAAYRKPVRTFLRQQDPESDRERMMVLVTGQLEALLAQTPKP